MCRYMIHKQFLEQLQICETVFSEVLALCSVKLLLTAYYSVDIGDSK